MINGNLKYYRKKAGYSTAKEFAQKIGIPYSTYSSYEKGTNKPTNEKISIIADKLGITTDELLGVMPDYTRYFRQVGYDVEEKEGVLYFASHWEVSEDTTPDEFYMDKLEYDNIVNALEDNHKKNIVKVVRAVVSARECKEWFKDLDKKGQTDDDEQQ